MKRKLFLPATIFLCLCFLGWGSVGHSIINENTILSALPQMSFFGSWADVLAAHASDADKRKSSDPAESPKHYIDIDEYPEFVATGMIPQDYDSVVAAHGSSFVIDQGTLPWAILNTADSLRAAFAAGDSNKAMLVAADLGHYIADAHMPLHITKNYNGQYTGQSGVHSRYESTLIGKFRDQIVYDGDSLQYIDDLPNYVFTMIYHNYAYVDSVLNADAAAKAYAGNTQDTAYYNKLWELTKDFTIKLFRSASNKIASVVYTEWINAGGSLSGITARTGSLPSGYRLYQNYPNPFNPTTFISYALPRESHVVITIYDALGRELRTLVDAEEPAGQHAVSFDAGAMAGGIYFYRFASGQYFAVKKMALVK